MTTTSIQSAIEAGHDEYDAPLVCALCEHDGCEPSDVTKERRDHYGLTVFSIGNREFAIGTDDESDKACQSYVEESAWAFSASFILSECDLPHQLEDAIQTWQEKECEGANDGIVSMIKKTCGMDSFVKAAISADGRGHFLSGYDGEETEVRIQTDDVDVTLYIYRIN